METSRGGIWAGRVMTTLAVVFLTFDALIKLLRLDLAVAGTVELGYPAGAVFGIGAVLIACVVLYAVPATSVLGAILLTGYLGGAIATHVRVESPWLTHSLFPIYVALLVWGGLVLRDARVRALVPLGRPRSGAG